ncbi:hypothetical protein ICC15_18595 (plasmid) [Piscirickettsia salmonis]|nr:hypothetical protein ICC15_18595 [Piscirickettsia salmonis]
MAKVRNYQALACIYFADEEPGAEVYVAATKRDQAKIVFDDAVKWLGRQKP